MRKLVILVILLNSLDLFSQKINSAIPPLKLSENNTTFVQQQLNYKHDCQSKIIIGKREKKSFKIKSAFQTQSLTQENNFLENSIHDDPKTNRNNYGAPIIFKYAGTNDFPRSNSKFSFGYKNKFNDLQNKFIDIHNEIKTLRKGSLVARYLMFF